MKLNNRLSRGLTLFSMILLMTIGIVNAQPVYIGATVQSNPYESNPTVLTVAGTTPPTYPARAYDGRFTTYATITLGDADVAGYVELSGFEYPYTWTIGWVDIKMRYLWGAPVDDLYSIEYAVGGSAWQPLQSPISKSFDSAAAAQIRVWAERDEPNDHSWSWTDIRDVKVRISFAPGTDKYSDLVDMFLYEVWLSVYKPPLPPSASTAISIQPPKVETLAAGTGFFVEVFVQSVTALAGYQFTLNYNQTVLSPGTVSPTPEASLFTYYPFTDEAAKKFDDTLGYVSMAYSIPTADPLVTQGVSGNIAIARIYFKTDLGATDYSWLVFSVSKIVNPAADYLSHGEYPGVYGTVPVGMHLMSGGTDITAPITTEWTEITPEPGRPWHINEWDDNDDGKLSVSDTIAMTSPGLPVTYFHVASFYESDLGGGVTKHYMDIKETITPPEFPLGIGILMAIAPMVAIVYVWRLRKRSR